MCTKVMQSNHVYQGDAVQPWLMSAKQYTDRNTKGEIDWDTKVPKTAGLLHGATAWLNFPSYLYFDSFLW